MKRQNIHVIDRGTLKRQRKDMKTMWQTNQHTIITTNDKNNNENVNG